MKELYKYLSEHSAVDFSVHVSHRKDGKVVATIHPSGIVGDPVEFKLSEEVEKK